MKTREITILLSIVVILLASCKKETNRKKYTDTPTSGVAILSCDETFAPVLDQEIDIFEHEYPKASLIPIYTDEIETVDLLLTDSVRLAIAARQLTKAEEARIKSNHLIVKTTRIAIDGIALIINKQNQDTILSLTQIEKILTGEITNWNQINKKSPSRQISLTFDNKNSSTVRFAIDSICMGKPLAEENIFAQGTNEKVIDYVAQTRGAIGVIGASWVGNKSDSTNLTFSERVRVVAVSREDLATPVNSYKPYQAYIAQGLYPITRDIFVINCSSRRGLLQAFTSFITSYKGQQIILKSGMVPSTQHLRLVSVKD